MVKVCVLARSFLDFKVFKQRKIDFPYFGRCFASYYDVLEDAKSYKCFFLFCGHTVHTFLPNSQTEPAFIFMAYQTELCSKVTCIHNDLALFVRLF